MNRNRSHNVGILPLIGAVAILLMVAPSGALPFVINAQPGDPPVQSRSALVTGYPDLGIWVFPPMDHDGWIATWEVDGQCHNPWEIMPLYVIFHGHPIPLDRGVYWIWGQKEQDGPEHLLRRFEVSEHNQGMYYGYRWNSIEYLRVRWERVE